METEKSLSEAFLNSLNQVKKNLFNIMSRQKVDGLRQSEFFMLMLIARCCKEQEDDGKNAPGIRISTLSKESQNSMPSVSQNINVLENEGYVERINTKEDRRVVYVRPTPKGEKLLISAPRPLISLLTKTTEEMGEEKTRQLMLLMDEFSETIMRLNTQAENKDK